MYSGRTAGDIMRHSFYRYFDDIRWAEAFLNGELFFRPLSYYQAYEDNGVRQDQNEGRSIFKPRDGLVLNNLTRGTTTTLPDHAFVSSAVSDEIFVLCGSKFASDRHRESFKAVACVEVINIRALCHRVRAALPENATFFGQRITYYQEADSCNPRWALPDKIATSKLAEYAWQDEYRLVFSLTGALEFENVELGLVVGSIEAAPTRNEFPVQLIHTESLRDIGRVHRFAY